MIAAVLIISFIALTAALGITVYIGITRCKYMQWKYDSRLSCVLNGIVLGVFSRQQNVIADMSEANDIEEEFLWAVIGSPARYLPKNEVICRVKFINANDTVKSKINNYINNLK